MHLIIRWNATKKIIRDQIYTRWIGPQISRVYLRQSPTVVIEYEISAGVENPQFRIVARTDQIGSIHSDREDAGIGNVNSKDIGDGRRTERADNCVKSTSADRRLRRDWCVARVSDFVPGHR